MGKHHSPKIVTDGLVLYLDAGNKRSYPGTGTTWIDLSGQGSNGTLVNGITFDSTNGGSLVFNGTNHYVNIPWNINFPAGAQPRTLCCLFKGNNKFPANLLGIGDNSGTGRRTAMHYNNLTVLGVETQGTGISVGNLEPIANRWIYYCFTFPDGATRVDQIKLYVNGVFPPGQGGSTATVNTAASQCVIGTIPGAIGHDHFLGRVSIAQMYNRELSLEEIQQNFNALRGRYGI